MARESDTKKQGNKQSQGQTVEKGDRDLYAGVAGRTDVTGIMPEGIRVDPDITEGHPGYLESGDSEIHPERSA